MITTATMAAMATMMATDIPAIIPALLLACLPVLPPGLVMIDDESTTEVSVDNVGA